MERGHQGRFGATKSGLASDRQDQLCRSMGSRSTTHDLALGDINPQPLLEAPGLLVPSTLTNARQISPGRRRRTAQPFQ